jgi:hypothetical protein
MHFTKTVIILAGLLGIACVEPSSVAGAEANLPSTEQFNSALGTCALGLDVSIGADLLGSVKSLYEGQRTSGAASFRTATKFLEQFPANDRTKAYQVYVGCVKDLLPMLPAAGQYSYLGDLYEREGVLFPMGWGYAPPDDLLKNQKEPLAIYPSGAGVFFPAISFIVSSSASANVKVERLYLKLKSYVACPLRNDRWKRTAGDQEDASFAIFMSEDFDTYPIKPRNSNLTASSWTFKGTDQNTFNIRMESKPYILYLFSVNIDYIDLTTSQKRHVESDQFSQIMLKGPNGHQGNMGGCLEIAQWLHDDAKLNTPTQKSYDGGIPYDVYQLLTSDLEENPGAMNVFINNPSLVARREIVRSIVAQRSSNTIFRSNYNSWIRTLAKAR